MSDQSVVKLSPGGERVMRALAAALIDPGELPVSAAAAAVPTPIQSFARITNRLSDDGLVELLGWNGRTYSTVKLTRKGWAVCLERGFPIPERT